MFPGAWIAEQLVGFFSFTSFYLGFATHHNSFTTVLYFQFPTKTRLFIQTRIQTLLEVMDIKTYVMNKDKDTLDQDIRTVYNKLRYQDCIYQTRISGLHILNQDIRTVYNKLGYQDYIYQTRISGLFILNQDIRTVHIRLGYQDCIY